MSPQTTGHGFTSTPPIACMRPVWPWALASNRPVQTNGRLSSIGSAKQIWMPGMALDGRGQPPWSRQWQAAASLTPACGLHGQRSPRRRHAEERGPWHCRP